MATKRTVTKVPVKREPENYFVPWLRSGIKKDGKSQAGLARALGIQEIAVSFLLRGERRLKADELVSAAKYLEEPLPQFPGVVRSRGSQPEFPITHVIGGTRLLQLRNAAVPNKLILDERFGHLPHWAAEVRTNHVDMVIPVGGYAIYVDYFDARHKIEDGDLVVAMLLKDSHPGLPIIRRIARGGMCFIMSCESSDSRLNADIIDLDKKLIEKDSQFRVELVGLVVYSIRLAESP